MCINSGGEHKFWYLTSNLIPSVTFYVILAKFLSVMSHLAHLQNGF